MERKCDCGGRLTECEIGSGISYVQTVMIPNGYNFPKTCTVKNYVCESCGRIYSYAEKKEKKDKPL
ncbi:MAG: hypothetical protein NC203_06860 [Firmicutes bacterium]|nr:hypothetical protein [[Eubacterium] siraeum]MCM1488068.1 hypothetical protein [Bacillota bacterium]